MIRAGALLLAAVAAAVPAHAVDLRIEYGALERMLAEQVFTQEGRRYVRGDKTKKCNFAYLEHPQVQGGGGKLQIKARFTGRMALNMLSQCVGLGDAFDLVIGARPEFREGDIRLRDITVASTGKKGFYISRVCASLASSLARDFKYPLAIEAAKALEDPGTQPGYRREVRRFSVPEIRVTGEALVLVVDFELTVK